MALNKARLFGIKRELYTRESAFRRPLGAKDTNACIHTRSRAHAEVTVIFPNVNRPSLEFTATVAGLFSWQTCILQIMR